MDGARCAPRNVIFQSDDCKPVVTGTPVTSSIEASITEHFKAAQPALAKQLEAAVAKHLAAATAFIAKRLEVVEKLEKQLATLQAEHRDVQSAAPTQWSSEPDTERVFQGTESSSTEAGLFSIGVENGARKDELPEVLESPQEAHPLMMSSEAEASEQSEDATFKEAMQKRRISAPAAFSRARELSQELPEVPGWKTMKKQKSNGESSTEVKPASVPASGFPDMLSNSTAASRRPSRHSNASPTKSEPSPREPCSARRMSVSSADSASTMQSVDSFYEVLPQWVIRSGAGTSRRDAVSATRVSFGSLRSLTSADLQSVEDDPEKTVARPYFFVIQPHTSKRAFWDVASFAFVMYDMTVIPLAFLNPPEFIIFVAMSWATRVFWTFDIFMSCVTGYMKPNGALELRWQYVVRQYLKTWFILDLFIVLLDWTELFWSGSNNAGYARLGKASRVFRVVRMLRLLRILRTRKLMMIITARIQSERLIIMAHMVQLMVILVGCSHLSACIWYGIGNASTSRASWVEIFFTEEDDFGYRYFSALHWSLCQFTGGMDEIRPSNLSERVFNILMFIVAFVMAAVFVSHLTSSMTQLNMMSSQQLLNLAALRRFLLENGISDLLSRRIQHSAQYAMKEQQRIMPEANVELLRFVAGTLRVELHYELYSPFLASHRFFSRYMLEFPNVVRRICHEAMSTEDYTKGDDVFTDGELPEIPKMFIVHTGRFQYERTLEFPEEVGVGTCLCEAAIWTRWRHKGTLTAASNRCRLCALEAGKFQQIVRQFRTNGFGPKEYANDFVQEMNQKGQDDFPISDLPLDLPKTQEKLTFGRRESLQKVMPWLNDTKITSLGPAILASEPAEFE